MALNSDPPPGGQSPLSDELLQYMSVYLDESEEELEGLTEAILRLEENPQDAEALHKAFRMLHSLKGSSGMLGFEVVGNFAHELEDRFDRYRSGKAVLDPETTTLILKGIDFFRAFLARLRVNDVSEGDPTELLNQLRAKEQAVATSSPAPKATTLALGAMTISGGMKVQVRFRAGLQLADLKARLIVARLSSIGEILSCEPPVDDLRSFEELTIFSLALLTNRSFEEVRKIANVDGVEEVEFLSGAAPMAPGFAAATIATSSPPEVQPATPKSVISEPEPVVPPVTAAPPTPGTPATAPTSPAQTVAVAPALQAKPSISGGRANLGETEGADARSQVSETLRVEIGRLDELMNLTGELVVANARFSRISDDLSPLFRRNNGWKKSTDLRDRLRERFERTRQLFLRLGINPEEGAEIFEGLDDELEALQRQAELWQTGSRCLSSITEAVDQLSRVSKNLQRGVLNTRMVPVGPLFNRFKRVVRDLSVDRRKQVNLVIQGEKTELDKRMIDALGDPLLHLVRNAIDHGLEEPADRLAAGKPEAGTITLEAQHSGNNVLITIRDDGGGIQIDRIRQKIIARGLASESVVRELSDAQAIDYIWHPGFSTAEAITEISGRGVGMDIVRNAISELSGTIDVTSIRQQGTTFTIRLPLTLAIIHSLLIQYGDDYFSIPIDDVREIVSVPRHQVHAVHRHRTIDVRGEMIPLVSMSGVFHWNHPLERDRQSPPASSLSHLQVVVLSGRGKALGLSVDALVGRSDIVIKSLSENYLPVRGLSGAGVLGDGSVCLMLDPAALIELASERAQAVPTST